MCVCVCVNVIFFMTLGKNVENKCDLPDICAVLQPHTSVDDKMIFRRLPRRNGYGYFLLAKRLPSFPTSSIVAMIARKGYADRVCVCICVCLYELVL